MGRVENFFVSLYFFRLAFLTTTERHREKTKPRFSLPSHPLSLSRSPTPRASHESPLVLAVRVQKQKKRKPALSDNKKVPRRRRKKTMAEALDTRGARLAAALNDADADEPRTINDLPKELLVSTFAATEDPWWVRHAIPLVCRGWAELYRSNDASPLHETLEVDFYDAVEIAKWERLRRVARPLAGAAAQELAPYRPVIHASRVIPWAQRRAGSVRKLRLVLMDPHEEDDERDEDDEGDLKDFSSGDLGTLIAVIGSSLTEIKVRFDSGRDERYEKQFWKSLRDLVVPAGRLRSLRVKGIESVLLESDVGPLAQLAGSLEELVLHTSEEDDFYGRDFEDSESGLSGFPKSLCALTELRRLELKCHRELAAIPAEISSLKKLEELELVCCDLSSLPKELGDLSALTKLNLSRNASLGYTLPAGEELPAELGRLKSRPLLLRLYHRPGVFRRAGVTRGPRSRLQLRPADRRPARLPD